MLFFCVLVLDASEKTENVKEISVLANVGLVPLLRTFDGSDKHVRKITFKHLPQPLRSHIRSFGTLGQLLKFKKN